MVEVNAVTATEPKPEPAKNGEEQKVCPHFWVEDSSDGAQKGRQSRTVLRIRKCCVYCGSCVTEDVEQKGRDKVTEKLE